MKNIKNSSILALLLMGLFSIEVTGMNRARDNDYTASQKIKDMCGGILVLSGAYGGFHHYNTYGLKHSDKKILGLAGLGVWTGISLILDLGLRQAVGPLVSIVLMAGGYYLALPVKVASNSAEINFEI